MKKTSKNKKEKMTNSQFQWKILKFLFFAYVIVLAIWLFTSNMLKGKKDIYEKIGYLEPYSISIKDALNIKNYTIIPYAGYILSGDTASAYDMLTEEYKDIVPYEEYINTLEGIDFYTFDMKEIKMKAEGTYVATIVYEKNKEKYETEYLLYLNEVNPKIIKISPNKFIYNFGDLKFKKDNIELKIHSCNIFTDSIRMKVELKNTSMFDTMEFKNIGVGYGEATNKPYNVEITLKPGEKKEIEIVYDTNYFLPNNIKVKRLLDENTLRTYTFYFENAK